MTVRQPRFVGYILAAVMIVLLAGCETIQTSPTPTLIVFPSPFPTAARIPTIIPLPTAAITPVYTVTPTIEPPPTRTPSITPTVSNTPLPTLGSLAGTLTANTDCPSATGVNLLVNGGFEGGQTEQEGEDIRVPEGWTGYWRPPGVPTDYDPANTDGYQRPEMRVISRAIPYNDPPRVLEGNQAFMITGGQRAFDAGIYQRVTVTAGDALCLAGSAHAWSNRYTDDPFSSTFGSGDDQRNANFQLGIDLSGGMDAFAATVHWGDVQHIYDKYASMNTVRATASGTTIAVFVRGKMLWRFNHNEMYFDSIRLVKTS